ncbi:MAG: dUTP diphosphatase [Lachnospiraceae bacterium]|nr:dUTP diphosphatase [Lachnospiraceae bacterium]
MKIIRNPDKKKYDEITAAIKARDGYCCCIIQKNDETRCMCKDFRDKVSKGIAGPCVCGRFIAVEDGYIDSEGIDVKFKLINGGRIPERKTAGAAGFDCYANEDITVESGERKLVKLGFALQMPSDFCAYILPRSGLTKSGIDVATGLIDSDYRAEVSANVINNRKLKVNYDDDGDMKDESAFVIHKGDRICQLVIQKIPTVNVSIVDELAKTERGEGGFGSTGVR